MDISAIKDIAKKLRFFKDYSPLLVPVFIVLVSVLILVFTILMGSKLKNQMMVESVSRVGKKVGSLIKSAVARDQWKVEQEYQQAYEKDANQTALLANQSSQRQLLSYKIFPEPKDTSALIFEEFGVQFRRAVERLLASVNARDCPTQAELSRSLQRAGSSGFRRGGVKLLKSLKSSVDAAIVDVICRERAESASVYANPADLSGYEFWRKQDEGSGRGARYEYIGMDESVADCWYSQLAYWIIEDVIDTIGSMNSGSKSIFTSPVKRLLGVNFKVARRSRSRSRSVQKGGEDKPSYVLLMEDGLGEPCTGRVCNDDIDVAHFNVSIVVSTEAFLLFMQQLCSGKQHEFSGYFGEGQEQIFRHNQITILESSFESIDREDDTHSLCHYGEDAVIKLDLVCEYIFDKNGYDEIKPALIKESLEKPAEKKRGRRG